jgi:two-component system sensor histidine kinase CreC
VVLSAAGVFLFLHLITKRIERSYLEAIEEPMVDTAETLAAIVSREIEASGQLDETLVGGFRAAAQRTLQARIYSFLKTKVLMDIYITDGHGLVQFDSGHPENVGKNFKIYRDVAMTLRGEYGARSTRENADEHWTVMYVGAPLIVHGRINGVLSVYKPQRSVSDFIEATQRSLALIGAGIIVVSLIIGAILSRWVTAPLVKLTQYASAIARGERPRPPRLPGRHLRFLGESLEKMRDALEGRKYVESYVQTLSHEMKAPVGAISG